MSHAFCHESHRHTGFADCLNHLWPGHNEGIAHTGHVPDLWHTQNLGLGTLAEFNGPSHTPVGMIPDGSFNLKWKAADIERRKEGEARDKMAAVDQMANGNQSPVIERSHTWLIAETTSQDWVGGSGWRRTD